jgi:hypothetical protein
MAYSKVNESTHMMVEALANSDCFNDFSIDLISCVGARDVVYCHANIGCGVNFPDPEKDKQIVRRPIGLERYTVLQDGFVFPRKGIQEWIVATRGSLAKLTLYAKK